ncbi:MAG: HIT family protein [Chloroflexota bacterium]|nr:HIT family protein [Chloroflexota bacterium]
MATDCTFCGIIARDVEASIVDEDAETMAFIDIRQFHPGHTLIVPKRHIENIFELDDATGAALTRTLLRVARAVRDAFRPDGMNVWQSNGAAGGQEVFHLHLHVLPRMHEDGMLRFFPTRPGRPPRTELEKQAALIRSNLRG